MGTKLIINADIIPPPFTFNPLKHHLGYLRNLINTAITDDSEKKFLSLINEIGPQLTDIYYGEYSLLQILQSIKSQLCNLSSFKKKSYEIWVDNSGKRYNFLELADHSKWIFRLGEKEGRYIHFHPARLSCSVRIRGTTLKTALALKLIAKDNTALYSNTDYINTIRKNVLSLSPIKDIKYFTAIRKILDLIGSIDISGR